jgi:two-component sensor histidine kinase
VADGAKGLAERVAFYARHGLRPHSPAAFAFAILCVGIATLVRLLVDVVTPQAVPFATYFPAVLAATLIGGRTAGGLATLLSAVIAWYVFIPPRFVWTVITRPEGISLILFVVACSTIIWIADQYRRVLRRLDEEEHYRQVVVGELGHRVKNKLATIQAILRHELRSDAKTWDSVSGRLRALSATDDLLLQPDRDSIEMRELLALELNPYGENRVRMQGGPLRLRGRVPSVLALIVHELATNAAKYGALSVEEGCVSIAWRKEAQEIAIDWKESGGPVVTGAERRSFGTNLIERSLDGFSGSARIDFPRDGLLCRIRFPCEPHVVG